MWLNSDSSSFTQLVIPEDSERSSLPTPGRRIQFSTLRIRELQVKWRERGCLSEHGGKKDPRAGAHRHRAKNDPHRVSGKAG
jgi:hypothetical protein